MQSRNALRLVGAILAWSSLAAVASAEEPTTPAVEPASAEEPMVDSQWFRVGWPKIQMPDFAWKSEPEAGAEAKAPGGNPVSRALDRVADSSRQASKRVRSAWGSTMNRLTSMGRSSDEGRAVAKSPADSKPGFWSRMFGSEEPKQSETVTEFLAQERVGATGR